MLKLEGVTKRFHTSRGLVPVVDNLSLEIAKNELVCLVGRSGCGKTTTLRMVAGLEQPSEGIILVDSKQVKGPGADRAVVFQRYTLYPWRTALENVCFGLEIQKVRRKERLRQGLHYLNRVGLADHTDSYPFQLSGGMQQRVAVARALACDPKVLLMDEPFGAMDARTRDDLQNELVNIWERDRKTILFITHSITEALILADRIVMMDRNPGRIKTIFEVVLSRPRNRYSESFRKLHNDIHVVLGDD
ncbi:NitT/TauT family transport system ATP-binding protein [Desulfonatronum zhilinae]|nr:NitT/TauT family transport system ATP-binding protein [Desulfonatronum zhilinae]